MITFWHKETLQSGAVQNIWLITHWCGTFAHHDHLYLCVSVQAQCSVGHEHCYCQGCTEGKSAASCRLDRWDTRTKQGAVQEFHAPQGLDRVAGHPDGYSAKESFRCLATSGKHHAQYVDAEGIAKCVCLVSTPMVRDMLT